MSDLIEHFHNRFDVLIGQGDALKDEAYRLRYQVYCVERGHGAEVAAANLREHDTFDDHATHVVVKDRSCGTNKATARLITAGATREGRFPIEHDYPDLLARHGITEDLLPRQHTAEISRFAISKELRERRPGTGLPAHQSTLDTREQTLPQGALHRRPLVTFGLLLGLIRLGASHDITHCMAVMKPSLLRMLSRFGVHFKPIGKPVEYHGLRQPCYTSVADLLAGIQKVSPELWQLLACDDVALAQTKQPIASPMPIPVQDKPTHRRRRDVPRRYAMPEAQASESRRFG